MECNWDGRRAPITVIPEAVTKPESMTRGRAPLCCCCCGLAPKPGGGWSAKLVRSRGTICTSGPAGLKRKTPAAFSGHGRHFAYIGNRQNRQESARFYLTPSLRTFGFD